MPIKVLLVDDHPMVIKGLRLFLQTRKEIQVVGEAGNGKQALAKVAELEPDVVLMDLMMPEMDGVEATKAIKSAYPQVKVVILTSFSDQDHVLPAIQAGAQGYQLKEVEADELVTAILAAHQGLTNLHPRAANQLVTHVTSETQGTGSGQTELDKLTPREKDVLEKITAGKSNKEIAAELFIAEKTVKTHVSNILSKLDLQDRTQAAIYAMKKGWHR
ncbi:response regulator transcription factor [Kroppenstedtia pulmonis]|uniref:Response regulator transcription factor n=1 Tax=Kroppenstedtia pulmonis TaxID=1380685 RepID=A0A7D4CEA5_9BACL|nr:response regulator transcription factor [Kroppenstedtia pulmonis]QKG83734.1 response regulator transcription factor [Kroppenstedtia pulmonis]